jgi:hypothetical protein
MCYFKKNIILIIKNIILIIKNKEGGWGDGLL